MNFNMVSEPWHPPWTLFFRCSEFLELLFFHFVDLLSLLDWLQYPLYSCITLPFLLYCILSFVLLHIICWIDTFNAFLKPLSSGNCWQFHVICLSCILPSVLSPCIVRSGSDLLDLRPCVRQIYFSGVICVHRRGLRFLVDLRWEMVLSQIAFSNSETSLWWFSNKTECLLLMCPWIQDSCWFTLLVVNDRYMKYRYTHWLVVALVIWIWRFFKVLFDC